PIRLTVGAAVPPSATPASPAAASGGAGGPPQSEEYFARKGGAGPVVTLSRYKVEALEKTADDLRPAPAPSAPDLPAVPSPAVGSDPNK
ncbi:MAG: hypothetical protein ACOY3Y_11665, partial [Acidobacteriota bacterium]